MRKPALRPLAPAARLSARSISTPSSPSQYMSAAPVKPPPMISVWARSGRRPGAPVGASHTGCSAGDAVAMAPLHLNPDGDTDLRRFDRGRWSRRATGGDSGSRAGFETEDRPYLQG